MIVNHEEIKKFTNIASEWWNYNGSFKLLHEINPIRIEYILSQAKAFFSLQKNDDIKKLKILDVGCGGGILSIPLSRLGAKVSGIDAGLENIEIAREKAASEGLKIDFECIKIEDFVKKRERFDLVICLEVLEHIDDPKDFLSSIAKLTKKDGMVVLSTINKTLKAKVLAIGIAEYILGLVPRGTHTYEKFITPYQLHQYCLSNQLYSLNMTGMVFDIKSREWKLSDDLDINYFVSLKKDRI